MHTRLQGKFWPLTALLATAMGCSTHGSDRQHVELDISPDGRQIVFSAKGIGESDLYLLDLSSLHVRPVTRSPEWESSPAFSPDGKSIVYAASASSFVKNPAHLYRCALDGSGRRRLTNNPDRSETTPSFSADGKRIAFARAARLRPYSMGGWVWDHWDIWLINADGSNAQRLTSAEYYQAYSPTFTHDGRHVLYTGDAAGQTDIYEVDAAGAFLPKPVTSGFYAAVGRNGKHVVFLSDRMKAFDYEVWRMTPDGTGAAQVTRNGSYNWNPRLMPDGRRVLFLSDPNREERFELWQIDLDGKNARQIADSRLFDDPLSWRP